ncbi:hypothetical protein M8J75_014216 [Diaphorina citri]|nr:hypothetical protein M8J75_014216 [Diaphorina citri]
MIHPTEQYIREDNLTRLTNLVVKLVSWRTLTNTAVKQWRIAWDEAAVAEAQHLPCIETQPPGFELTRRLWVTLKCAANLHKWGLKSSAACDCGAEKQTILHIIQDCPRRRCSGDLKDFSTLNQSAINYINQLDLNV